jgi:serine/threonine protein kinase
MAPNRDYGSGRHPRISSPFTPPVTALMVAARRRKLVDDVGARLLGEVGLAAGIQQAADWIPVIERGIAGVDGAALLRLLPRGDDVFGLYRPLAHLANGGMGAVWVTVAADGVTLAVLKHTRMDTGRDRAVEDRMRRRFSREASIHRNLHHPNVLRCLDVGISAKGQCYLVLEYVDGGDMGDLINRFGPLPEAVALTLIYQVVDGLSEAHRLRLVHRDIKPANIFLTGDGSAKLSDFGIARKEGDASSQLTLSGTVLGSPYYMSPEQVNANDDIDIRSDLYAIGGILCYALTGRPPYAGKATEAMHQHATSPPPDLRAQGVTLSDATVAIIAKCMAKDRANRYAEPLDLRADLSRARADAGDTDVGSWMRGDALGAEIDLNQTLGLNQVAGVAVSPQRPTTSAPAITTTSAIRFREPEEIRALIAAREAQRARPSSTTEVVAIPPASSVIPAVTSPIRRSGTEPLLPHWLVLAGGTDGRREVHLFAQDAITLGKLAKPPVDLTTLLYPIYANQTACNRISRAHCVLRAEPNGFTVTDLETVNGTSLHGERLPSNRPEPIVGSAPLVLANVLELQLTPVPVRRLGAEPDGMSASLHEALAITRLANRPDLAYALVQRSLLVGGAGCDLAMPGYSAGCGLLVARTTGGWMQRLQIEGRPHGPWNPLAVGMVIGQGSQRIVVRLGDYTQLTR